MSFKFNIKREIMVVAIVVTLFGLIAFTERMKGEVTVSAIKIELDNIHDNHYLEEKDILRLMRLDINNLRGAKLSQLNFSEIEQRIRQSPYVRNAELFSDLKGNLMVNVTLRRPVARMVQSKGPDAYIGEDGTIMPVSGRFSSRVILISGEMVPKILPLDNIHELEGGEELMHMLEQIRNDPFWKAQIAQVDINEKARTILYMQVGDESIEFGKPEDVDTKLRKLKIFYKEIFPRVGWNKYDRINVEYQGQVVAE